jgi:TfoX/Sxy family transcriptional regulator of competence genes
MSHDQRLAARVRKILSARRDVSEKRMVGGLSFLVDGKMCCGVAGDALMVRVGAEARETALAEPHVKLMNSPAAAFPASSASRPPVAAAMRRSPNG